MMYTVEKIDSSSMRVIVYPVVLSPEIKITHDFTSEEEMNKYMKNITEDQRVDVV